MKRFIIFVIAILFLLAGSTAYAEPGASSAPETSGIAEPSPTPAKTPAPNPDGYNSLISYGAEGETVLRVQIRLRELGFFNFKPTGKFQSMSVDATKKFQMVQTGADGLPIMSDGTIGAQSMAALFSLNAKRSEITAGIPIGGQTPTGNPENGSLVPWKEVKELLTDGAEYKVTDYNTSVSFMLKYSGGENHAEMESATADDTATLKRVFGNDFSFFKRAVTIEIDGRKIAASLQGQPHGRDMVPGNDMAGHICMFFDGSLSHVGSLPDAEHVNQVYRAAGRQ